MLVDGITDYLSRVGMLSVILSLFFLCPNISHDYVYICTGPTAYAYHKTDTCKGLRRCTGDIKKISLEQAKKENRKACKLCYKKK